MTTVFFWGLSSQYIPVKISCSIVAHTSSMILNEDHEENTKGKKVAKKEHVRFPWWPDGPSALGGLEWSRADAIVWIIMIDNGR